jgi:hypothetical protein
MMPDSNAWKTVNPNDLYVVRKVKFGAPAFVETPIDQGLPDKVPQVSIVRVFATRAEAEIYYHNLVAYYEVEFEIRHVLAEQLYLEMPAAESLSKQREQVPVVQYVLSTIKRGEHPKSVEVLWTNEQV